MEVVLIVARRRYFALRALVDDFIDRVRALNRIAVRATVGGTDPFRAGRELDRIQHEMRQLVEGMRDVAAKEGRVVR